VIFGQQQVLGLTLSAPTVEIVQAPTQVTVSILETGAERSDGEAIIAAAADSKPKQQQAGSDLSTTAVHKFLFLIGIISFFCYRQPPQKL
jgi:hypothetical protein